MKPVKITRSQYEAAYHLGVKKLKGGVGITAAIKELQELGLNRSSAADLVYNATHLIKGRRYTRMLSVPATDDYLKWITRDFKTEGLTHAISALEKHILYYEALQKTRLHAHRQILEKHRTFLAPTTTQSHESTLNIEWLDRASSGWIDLLPLHWFENEGTLRDKQHDVISLDDQPQARARCDVAVSESFAELNYEKHAKFNDDQEMYLGVARIHFSDTDRTRISKLEWRPAGKTTFKPYAFRTANLQIPDEDEYHPPTDEAPRKPVMLRERPGQAAFRKKLKGAYNHTCCISGCEVSDALDGAHIDAFRSKASDNLRNGLLLRRDIHALYDRHLIAIEPGTHVIHVAESIRTTTDYAPLHGKSLRLPNNPTHHPSQSALKRRWVLFVKKTK
jgi:hypothetical protein